jgi:hypothetical protein
LINAHRDDEHLKMYAVDIALDYPDPREVELQPAKASTTPHVDSTPIYREQQLIITDDFHDVQGWVGLSTGDIYVGGAAFGTYLAYWRPNLAEPAWLVVTCLNERLETVAAIGVELSSNDGLSIRPVDDTELPWGADHFDSYLAPGEIDAHSKAAMSLALVESIVKNDAALCKLFLDPSVIVKPW